MFAAVTAWLGWLSISPALGFPSLATAAMVNGVLVPGDDPGSLLGWALLLIGLFSAALVYVVAIAKSRLRPSVASGLIYGLLCWLIAGVVVMPLLGLVDPASLTASDAMHGSFMMLHLGVGAPIDALIAWLMFGGVLGAATTVAANGARTPRSVGLGVVIGIVTILVVGTAGLVLDSRSPGPAVTATQLLATAPTQVLPKGIDYISVLELGQPPGATLGPHSHPYAGFAYSLKGVASIVFDDGQTVRVEPGGIGFIGTQAAHAHRNTDDVVPSAALAVLMVVLAAAVCLVGMRPRRASSLLAVLLVALIATGTLAATRPWWNDWLFLSVRPIGNRGSPMPVWSASRIYESQALTTLSGGSYVPTLEQITIATGDVATDVASTGPALLLVVDGSVAVQPSSGPASQLAPHGTTLLDTGTSLTVTNTGGGAARLLKYTLVPAPSSG